MTRNQQNRFKRSLLMKRDELIRTIGVRREGLAISPASDPMDQVSGWKERDLAAGTLERTLAVLRRVDDALRAIENGVFGVCSNCGESIPSKRLDAVPWTPFCVGCQDAAERSVGSEQGTEPFALAS